MKIKDIKTYVVDKALGQPVYNLLSGQVHERVRSYTHLYPAREELARKAESDDLTPVESAAGVFGDAEIVKEPIRWEDGYIIPPTVPGLGIELDEEVAERHPYTGDILYIDMVERPV